MEIRKSYVISFVLLLSFIFPLTSAFADLNRALLKAAKKGHTEKLSTLLYGGADVNAKTRGGWTALMLAAAQGHIDTVQILLDAGADMNVKEEIANSTALTAAAINGHTEIVKILLIAATDLDADQLNRAFRRAATFGHPDAVQVLLDAGADVNSTSITSPTALWLARENGHTEVVKMLKKAGAKEPKP